VEHCGLSRRCDGQHRLYEIGGIVYEYRVIAFGEKQHLVDSEIEAYAVPGFVEYGHVMKDRTERGCVAASVEVELPVGP
jgi:hypothetical protein